MIPGRGAALARDVVFVVDGAAAASAASTGAASAMLAAASGKTGLEDLEGLGESGACMSACDDPVYSILEGATPGRSTKGRTQQWIKNGGYEKALEDFHKLNPQNIRDLEHKRSKVGTLPDGRTVNVRKISSEGSPTLEILSGQNKIKIRYKL